jgi:curved DNA-binding protein CbpA
MDYYVVLGIAEDADEDMIRSAFRALARRYHPDAGPGASPVEFQRAREAYETLIDPERRRGYDRGRRASRVQPIVVREPTVSKPFAEPLFDSRRRPFDAKPSVPLTGSSLFDRVVEALFASFEDDGVWARRRR